MEHPQPEFGGGYGNFGANIVGRVVNVPGESAVWKGLGLGLTWRTPWNGQLSVGADNVVTRGRNPFSTPEGAKRTTRAPSLMCATSRIF